MPATEELRVYIRTIADTSGVKQTQRAVQESRRSLSAAGAAAIGGIAGVAAGQLTNQVQNLVGAFGESVQAAREHERVIRATGMAYGQAAGQFQTFAQQLSATTGFTSDAILEAALSARTLSQNYGLSIQQTQKLIKVSGDLARLRGIGIAESFERVQSAIRGEAEASEYLGLTLNDTFLTNQAMNGSLKNTFGTMTDVQKAQVRYNELLRQTEAFSGLAATSADSLDAAFGRAEVSANKLAVALGNFSKPATTAGLKYLTDLADRLSAGFRGENEDVLFSAWVEALAKGESLAGASAAAWAKARPGVTVISNDFADLKDRAEQATKAIYDTAAAAKRIKDAATEAALPKVTVISRDLQDLKELRDQAGKLAQTAFLDQVGAAVRELKNSQQEQLDLQHQAVDLAAQEASIRLSMLPAAERLAAAQRDVAEAQIRARQAALPASEALEDLRYEQQRAQLIVQNRNSSAAERIAARRELRDLARAAPGVELAALVAGRGVTTAGRAAQRVGDEAQLFQINQDRQLAQVTAAQQSNKWLQQIAEQKTQAIQLTINLTGEAFSQEVFKQLIEANNQAQGPTTIPQSGVRR